MFKILSDVRSKDIMRPDVLSMSDGKAVADAVALMAETNRGSVSLLDDKGKLSGIFTERDLMCKVVAKGLDPKKTPLNKVMTKNVLFVEAETNGIQLLEIMGDHNFRHLPVLENGKLVGIISLKQFYKFFLESRKSMGV